VVLHDYALYKSTFTLLYFTYFEAKAIRDSPEPKAKAYKHTTMQSRN